MVKCSFLLVWFLFSSDGQCGLSRDIKRVRTPTKIEMYGQSITTISVGNEFNLMIDINGKLWSFGSNMDNQCGIKSNNAFNVYLPQINHYFDNSNIKMTKICCGSDYGLCIDTKGKCYSFGCNSYGQCGGDRYNLKNGIIYEIDIQLIQTDDQHGFNGFDGESKEDQDDEYLYDDKVIECESGGYHSLLLTEFNHLYVFGANDYNQCSSTVTSQCIRVPFRLNKFREFGDDKCFIERVIGLNNDTIVIINPHKKCL